MSLRVISLLAYCCFLSIFQSCTKKETPKPVKIISEGIKMADVGKINIDKDEDGAILHVDYPGKATFEYDGITIVGVTSQNNVNVTLALNGQNTGTYNLGGGYPSYAVYKTRSTDEYSSDSESGKVIITEIDTKNKTITGTYEFYGYSYYYGNATISGTFNKIPYTVSSAKFTNSFSAALTSPSAQSLILKTLEVGFQSSQVNITATNVDNTQVILNLYSRLAAGQTYYLDNAYSTAYFVTGGSQYNINKYYSTVKYTANDRVKRVLTGTYSLNATPYSYQLNGSFSVHY